MLRRILAYGSKEFADNQFGTIYVEKIRINLAFREVPFFVENKKMLVGKKKSVPFYEFLLFCGNCLSLIRKKNDYFRMFLVFLLFSNKAKDGEIYVLEFK